MPTLIEPPKIIWQDDDLLVVDKPVGLLVDSGGKGDDLVTWTRALGFHSSFAFHRLDRETSGLVLLGKTRRYAREMSALFEEKRIRKTYLAVVAGEWPSHLNRVELPIEERAAATTFRRLAVSNEMPALNSVIECLPKTGRTHQIRIHCRSTGHAILGDRRYGTPDDRGAGHALHAYRLDFRHPAGGETLSLRSLPENWKTTWLCGFASDKIWQQLIPKITGTAE